MMWNSRIVAVLIVAAGALPFFAAGQTAEELRNQISAHQEEISKLNAEIAQYEKDLTTLGSKKQTLQTTLNSLDISRKQITAKIAVTKTSIENILLEIKSLNGSIGDKEKSIDKDEQALAQAIIRLREADEQTMIEYVLGSGSISDIWDEIETTQRFQDAVTGHINELNTVKEALTEDRDESMRKQEELEGQRKKLIGEQTSLDINRREQQSLLTQTKNQESNYQKILKEKQAAKVAFEQAMNELESKLQFTLDPSKIPSAGKGILRWPLDAITVTQYFGDTEFAKSGAYGGKGHNGIDFRATVGTPVKSALSGTVEGTGNSDAIKGCYSYGKWILIKHPNGLSTLYAHLSQVGVSKGDTVTTGQIIGYSGSTGYATGPHLHFSVYAANGVKITRLGTATGRQTPCANAEIPVAAFSAYLNPMDYL